MSRRIFLVFLAVSLMCSACAVSDRIVLEDAEGVVPKSFFETVRKNKTKKDWLIKNLGPAHQSESYPENIEVLTYHFKRTRYRKASALLLLNFHGSEGRSENYHVLLCGGVVKKAWFDELMSVQLLVVAKRRGCKLREIAEGEKADIKTMPETVQENTAT